MSFECVLFFHSSNAAKDPVPVDGSLVGRYIAGIIDWTIAELEDLDRKTRKLMTAHRTLHPQSDIDRLYLPRRIGEEDSCRSDRQ